MQPFLFAPLMGMAAAVVWGASDFSGGLAAKRASVWWVVFFSQFVGAIYLFIMAASFGESLPSWSILLSGALAGVIGEFGLILLYQGLASGRMSIVAPLSALISALQPAVFGWFTQGVPLPVQAAGIVLALPAVWLVSSAEPSNKARRAELILGLAAGLAFGIYFILIGHASSQSVFWTLAAGRLASLSMLIVLVVLLRPVPRPVGKVFIPIFTAGLLDSTGNLFYALATRYGRLDIAAVLSSLYPAVTILLAFLVLHEGMTRSQWAGVILALVAIMLISLPA